MRRCSRSHPATHARPGITFVEVLAIIVVLGVLLALLFAAMLHSRESAHRAQCLNNLKQLAIAVHNYYDSYDALPIAAVPSLEVSEGGDGNWGWTPTILPYIDSRPIYDWYRAAMGTRTVGLEEVGTMPPPSTVFYVESGRPLVPASPNDLGRRILQGEPWAAFRCPSSPGDDTNKFFAWNASSDPADWYSTSNYVANPCVLSGYITFADITDGTSNVFLFGERALVTRPQKYISPGGVIWGISPGCSGAAVTFMANWPPNTWMPSAGDYSCKTDPNGPDACKEYACTSGHPGGVQFAFCDGSAHFISETIASNPTANWCIGNGRANPPTHPQDVFGPGYTYQNLYVKDDGNLIHEEELFY